MRMTVTKFIYWFSRGIEISTISCRFSLNSYSLARYFSQLFFSGPGLPYNNAFSASKYVFSINRVVQYGNLFCVELQYEYGFLFYSHMVRRGRSDWIVR